MINLLTELILPMTNTLPMQFIHIPNLIFLSMHQIFLFIFVKYTAEYY